MFLSFQTKVRVYKQFCNIHNQSSTYKDSHCFKMTLEPYWWFHDHLIYPSFVWVTVRIPGENRLELVSDTRFQSTGQFQFIMKVANKSMLSKRSGQPVHPGKNQWCQGSRLISIPKCPWKIYILLFGIILCAHILRLHHCHFEIPMQQPMREPISY